MNKNSNEYWNDLDQKYYLPVFKRFPIALERAEGCYVYDVEGKKYLDLLAGIAVNNVGHCHPHVVQAIQGQAAKMMHVSNFFVSKPQMNLAKKLVNLSGLDRAFFTNSGAESVEGAVKVARKYAKEKGRGGRVVTVKKCFHGRTLGTIAMGKREKQQVFGPLPAGFVQVEMNEPEDLNEYLTEETAAIIIEPIQGEGGIHVAEKKYLEALRKICDDHDIVLIFDEIQCGMARTGHMFGWQYFNVKPDIITLAKGLGAGFPVGAFLTAEKVAKAMDYGDHGTTFGGNPLACAAALASVEVLENEKLAAKAAKTGDWLVREINELKKDHPVIREVRGTGLMLGVVMEHEAKPLVMALLDRGIIANATAGNVLRLLPPLTIRKEQLQQFLHILAEEIQEQYA